MKLIHRKENWKQMELKSYGDREAMLACALHGVEQNGTMYPPISWRVIITAMRAASRSGLQKRLPQVWLRDNTEHVAACVWEICAKHEWGTYDDLKPKRREAINALVCQVHAHLGANYNQFVIA